MDVGCLYFLKASFTNDQSLPSAFLAHIQSILNESRIMASGSNIGQSSDANRTSEVGASGFP